MGLGFWRGKTRSVGKEDPGEGRTLGEGGPWGDSGERRVGGWGEDLTTRTEGLQGGRGPLGVIAGDDPEGGKPGRGEPWGMACSRVLLCVCVGV